MKSNHTNFIAASEGSAKPEFETPGLVVTCPLTSINPMNNHERRYVYDVKRAGMRFFERCIFDEQDETE